ncbi:hypothetical protein JHK85_014849 [Glycine max]|nr:hypothetical protein JHK85_014849 [Glycine max]
MLDRRMVIEGLDLHTGHIRVLTCRHSREPHILEEEEDLCNKTSEKQVLKQGSFQRLCLSDISIPSSPQAIEDLSISISLVGPKLHTFTLDELREATHNFSWSNFLGEGGFGPVYKGFVDDKLRPGLKAQPLAVKQLDLDGLQGHREWLDYTAKLSDLGLAKDGPEGEATHVTTTCIMGTRGYAAPEYIMSGHLSTKSDVYSYGVVLLELLTGRRVVDKCGSNREQSLVEWARPLLRDQRKLHHIIDPRLEGQFPMKGALKVAALTYKCLSRHPNPRPSMSDVVKILESLQDFDDVIIGPFVYVAG